MSVPLERNTAGQSRYIFLFDSSNSIVTTPTIVAGDIQVAIGDGAFGNLTTLPAETPGGSGKVKVSFSQVETDGVSVILRWIDQAGAEWVDGGMTIETETQTIGELGTTVNQATILARIGAFTGTGIHTILGFLQTRRFR